MKIYWKEHSEGEQILSHKKRFGLYMERYANEESPCCLINTDEKDEHVFNAVIQSAIQAHRIATSDMYAEMTRALHKVVTWQATPTILEDGSFTMAYGNDKEL